MAAPEPVTAPSGVGGAVLAAVQALVAGLAEVDVAAAVEPAEVQVPGCWVALRALDTASATLTSPGTARVDLYLIASDTGDTHALGVLAGLLDRVLERVEENDRDTIDLGSSVVLPDTPALPAFRVPVDLVL